MWMAACRMTTSAGYSRCTDARAVSRRQKLPAITQSIADQPKSGGGLASTRIEEVVARIRKAPVLKDALETTFGKMSLREGFRHICQSRSGERRIEDLTCCVERLILGKSRPS